MMEMDPYKILERKLSEENGTAQVVSIELLRRDVAVSKVLADQLKVHLGALAGSPAQAPLKEPMDVASTLMAMEPVTASLLRFGLKYNIPFGQRNMLSTELAAELGVNIYRTMEKALELREETEADGQEDLFSG